MKHCILLIKTLSLAFLLFCLTGCEKDHACEGDISIQFDELAESIKIYPITENISSASCIYESETSTTHFERTLNSGNYIVVCSIKNQNTYYSTEKGFQIRDGQTTSLYLDANGKWTLK